MIFKTIEGAACGLPNVYTAFAMLLMSGLRNLNGFVFEVRTF